MKWRKLLIFSQLRLKGKYVYLFSCQEYNNMLRNDYIHQKAITLFRNNMIKTTLYKNLTHIKYNNLVDDFNTQC